MKMLSKSALILTMLTLSCQKDDVSLVTDVSSYKIDPNQNCFSTLKNSKFVDDYTEGITYNMKTVRNIGLIFNVIRHTDGKARIMDRSLLQKQVDILNQNFSGTDPDFVDYTPSVFKLKAAGDTKLRFYIKAINRRDSEYVVQKGEVEWYKTKEFGITATDPTRYVNVWIADYVLNEEGNIFSGYSSIPGVDKVNEGVIIGSQFIYDPNPVIPAIKSGGLSKGKILAHEIGHLLGLYHLSGMYGSCTDDMVTDTPAAATNHTGIANYPLYEVCGDIRRSQMFSNYMDYTHETQRTMFTKGQLNKIYYNFRLGGTHEKLGY